MSMYNFSRLIRKYTNPMALQIVTDGYYDEGTGEYVEGYFDEETGEYVEGYFNKEEGQYVEGKMENLEFEGAIMPLKASQIYQSGGRLTESDRALYSLSPLEVKTKVIYKDKIYSIEAEEDYSDFGDFYYYLLKAVSAFYAETE